MDGNRGSSTGLATNVGSTLAYVGLWVSGIVFLFVETKDRTVRFHAMQSTITFIAVHTLMLIIAIVRGLYVWAMNGYSFPVDTVLVILQSLIFAGSVALWIVFMVWSYQGRMLVLPVVGDLAIWGLDRIDGTTSYATVTGSATTSRKHEMHHARHVSAGEHTRAGRIAGSIVAIVWAIIVFIVFNVYPEYIAYYQGVSADGVDQLLRYPILTAELNVILPILNVALGLTIVGHIIAIVFDHYVVRQVVEVVLHVLAIVVVAAFLRVFPFDYSELPIGDVVEVLPTVTIAILVAIIVLLTIGIIVRIVKTTAHLVGGD